jgi:hypothetical protein
MYSFPRLKTKKITNIAFAVCKNCKGKREIGETICKKCLRDEKENSTKRK